MLERDAGRCRRGLTLAVALACAACGSSNGPPGGGGSFSAGGFPGVNSAGGFGGGAQTTAGGAFGSGGVFGAGGTFGAGGSSRDGGTPRDATVSNAGSGSGEGGVVIGAPIPPPAPVGCVTDVTPGVHTFACDTTTDIVSIPQQCTKTACGVIVDVHGGMMSSQMEDKNTNLRALGNQYGYIVIQPNALQNAIFLNQRLFVAGTDDTRVMDILTQVIQAFHADQSRIHMTGFSEGGFMTWRWFCQHSDILASIAPGAAAWQCANLAALGIPEVGCQFIATDAGTAKPARNIPVLYIQGMKDGLVSPTCADTWLKSNVFSVLKLGTGQQIDGDTTFTRTRYLDPSGVPFEYIQHQYTTDSSFLGFALVGHCYPGSTDLVVTPPAQTVVPPDQLISFGCKEQCSFNWGEEVMKFFMAHPKRP
jgi:poly(3-hydroxybutyrate) depolymerase